MAEIPEHEGRVSDWTSEDGPPPRTSRSGSNIRPQALSLQEVPRPRYVVYYTVEIRDGRLRERVLLVDTRTFVAYADWDRAGQPITDAIPEAYGAPAKKRYANVADETDRNKPLDHEVTSDTFSRLRGELHDVIWGGGGTNNNDVFVYITKLILCKIYDEKETLPGSEYRFQRRGDAVTPEPAVELTDRMNDLYREAERAYLALPTPGIGPAFDPSRISPEKVAYVVGRLEAISVTENTDSGDLLGEFFEQIVSQDFTQTRGQFFTPIKLVHFMLSLSRAVERARTTMVRDRDHLGRPRLPYLIDPSAGSGTFLIQYMKALRSAIGGPDTAAGLPARVREAHQVWFGGATGMTWARDHLFAIENNIDLGLAAKVNMVLHGDGSMNTWIMNGLLPFGSYWVNGRTNILGVTTPPIAHPYGAPRNEQFDLVMSNPPFSIDITPDEAEAVSRAFAALTAAGSEALFLERWAVAGGWPVLLHSPGGPAGHGPERAGSPIPPAALPD